MSLCRHASGAALILFPADGLPEPEMCIAAELDKQTMACFGLEYIDGAHGTAARYQQRPVKQQTRRSNFAARGKTQIVDIG